MIAKFALLLVIIECGRVSCTDNRIVGGRPALDGEFPFQVSLRRSYNDKHFCGGSLIDAKHVITAAHCMYYIWGGILPPSVVSAVAGQLNLTTHEETVFRNASKITIHEKFDKVTMQNDVAIIEFDEPFPIATNPLITVVPLNRHAASNASCLISGWGVLEFESELVSEQLLAAEVKLVANDVCNRMYGGNDTLDTIHDNMLCAHEERGERDACQGDSGGPLLCNGYLTGIISTGRGCADPQYPGIYANISHLFEWILSNADLETYIDDIDEPATNNTNKSLLRADSGNRSLSTSFNYYITLIFLTILIVIN